VRGYIYLADELGSGVRKLMKYGKAFGRIDPELIERDIFRIIVRYPDSGSYDNAPATSSILPSSREAIR
jgi:predicted HTH transcriptional regulator